MILELISIKEKESKYTNAMIKHLRFRDIHTGKFHMGYLDPGAPVVYNTILPILRLKAHYIGYTWPNRNSLDMKQLTLAAVQPVVHEQLSLFD